VSKAPEHWQLVDRVSSIKPADNAENGQSTACSPDAMPVGHATVQQQKFNPLDHWPIGCGTYEETSHKQRRPQKNNPYDSEKSPQQLQKDMLQ
jgi:hypothetical protein